MGVPEHVRRAVLTRIAVSVAAVRPIPSITSLPVTAMIRPITAACHTCNSAKSVRPLPEATRQEARAEAWIIADDVASLAERYRQALQIAKRRIREGSTPIG